jgi:prepilin-type N-terminal cleavage/methylation domain-containing protein
MKGSPSRLTQGRYLRRTRRNAPRGFTLVELMVVVIILGLIGGIAVTAWAAMLPNQQFNSAVRNLSEVLYGTRSDAIAGNREYRIRYDIDEDTYKVRTPFRPGGGLATSERDDEHLWAHDTDLKESGIDLLQVTVDDRTYTDGPVEVYFLPLGGSSHHVVQLRQTSFGDDARREFTLEVLPLTGEIRMHEGLFAREPVDEGDFR